MEDYEPGNGGRRGRVVRPDVVVHITRVGVPSGLAASLRVVALPEAQPRALVAGRTRRVDLKVTLWRLSDGTRK